MPCPRSPALNIATTTASTASTAQLLLLTRPPREPRPAITYLIRSTYTPTTIIIMSISSKSSVWFGLTWPGLAVTLLVIVIALQITVVLLSLDASRSCSKYMRRWRSRQVNNAALSVHRVRVTPLLFHPPTSAPPPPFRVPSPGPCHGHHHLAKAQVRRGSSGPGRVFECASPFAASSVSLSCPSADGAVGSAAFALAILRGGASFPACRGRPSRSNPDAELRRRSSMLHPAGRVCTRHGGRSVLPPLGFRLRDFGFESGRLPCQLASSGEAEERLVPRLRRRVRGYVVGCCWDIGEWVGWCARNGDGERGSEARKSPSADPASSSSDQMLRTAGLDGGGWMVSVGPRWRRGRRARRGVASETGVREKEADD
jgi:hypothetical protein